MTLERLHTRYKLTIEVLTPLHIGSGHKLWRDLDYVARNGRTWVINHETLLEATLDEYGTFDNRLLSRPIPELLRDEDYRPDSPYFRYIMPGMPVNRPLSEQIKDVWGRPYLPGSSVKGALRTLLLWGIFKANEEKGPLAYPAFSDLDDKDSRRAAQRIEIKQFAPKAKNSREVPNKDVLRALQVGDSTPLTPDVLRVMTARVYPTGAKGKSGVDVDVEAIRVGSVFELDVTIDEYGFADQKAKEQLGWDKLRRLLHNIPKIGQFHACQRIVGDEKQYYERKGGPAKALDFYKRLKTQLGSLNEGEWFMQIGWGAGWNSKTLNDRLSLQKQFEQSVVWHYNLDRGKHMAGEPFPSSRKLIVLQNQPAVPMGWVKCRLEQPQG
jgi:CRISPR-associated protein Csm5